MRVALGQINPTVGDIRGNLALIMDSARRAAQNQAELIVFPELCVTGYPPRDLVERPSFVDRSEAAIEELAAGTKDLSIGMIVGYVGRSHEASGKGATNSAAIIKAGKILLRQTKILLPTYD